MNKSSTTQTEERTQPEFTAFSGQNRIASGELALVATKTKEAIERGEGQILIFADQSGAQIEIDFRGGIDEVIKRLEHSPYNSSVSKEATIEFEPEEQSPRGPGRPKIGVVAREVTLMPRHWDWLNTQPGGASVALRRLVEGARKANASKDIVRQSQEISYKFISAMAGNLPQFEEASRALFACNEKRFVELTQSWPADVQAYAMKLAMPAFSIGHT